MPAGRRCRVRCGEKIIGCSCSLEIEQTEPGR